jgi:hypothetical protein
MCENKNGGRRAGATRGNGTRFFNQKTIMTQHEKAWGLTWLNGPQ